MDLEISIHAPTWGATPGSVFGVATPIFQSTHPRGVRPPRALTGQSWREDFNPRTHVGCDSRESAPHRSGSQFQSTHPRGVRRLIVTPVQAPRLFQSTHPRGVRPLAQREALAKLLFQSTHPRGVRHGGRYLDTWIWKFQSTHPRGVRHRQKVHDGQRPHISIHAPTWGATK